SGVTLAEVGHALDERDILHSAIVPLRFRRKLEQGTFTSGASMYLGGLLGDHLLARSFFFASRFASYHGVQRMIERAFPAGAVSFTEYYGSDNRQLTASRTAGERWDQGTLGVLRVREIRIAVPDVVETRRRWSLLLDPASQVALGEWRLG